MRVVGTTSTTKPLSRVGRRASQERYGTADGRKKAPLALLDSYRPR
jgi:hypothetical protein